MSDSSDTLNSSGQTTSQDKENVNNNLPNVQNTAPKTDAKEVVMQDAPKEVAPPAPNESLEKLLKHIQDLKTSNSELEAALNIVKEGNLEKLKGNIDTKLKPWIDSLNIDDKQKELFLQGVTNACSKSQSKTLNDFEQNPVYEVMCSAAATHGRNISELEKARAELKDAREGAVLEKNHSLKEAEDRANAMLYADAGTTASVGSKRSADDISESNDTVTGIWSAMFDTMRQSNGRF